MLKSDFENWNKEVLDNRVLGTPRRRRMPFSYKGIKASRIAREEYHRWAKEASWLMESAGFKSRVWRQSRTALELQLDSQLWMVPPLKSLLQQGVDMATTQGQEKTHPP
ncbi:hypothetical protein AAG906_007055 [Vitis piasezkii]